MAPVEQQMPQRSDIINQIFPFPGTDAIRIKTLKSIPSLFPLDRKIPNRRDMRQYVGVLLGRSTS